MKTYFIVFFIAACFSFDGMMIINYFSEICDKSNIWMMTPIPYGCSRASEGNIIHVSCSKGILTIKNYNSSEIICDDKYLVITERIEEKKCDPSKRLQYFCGYKVPEDFGLIDTYFRQECEEGDIFSPNYFKDGHCGDFTTRSFKLSFSKNYMNITEFSGQNCKGKPTRIQNVNKNVCTISSATFGGAIIYKGKGDF